MGKAGSKLSHKKLAAFCLAFILLAVHSTYRQVKSFDMLVYDDFEHIIYNPHVVNQKETIEWASIWREPYFDLYVPLAYSMWALVVSQSTSPTDRDVDPLTLAGSQPLASALHAINLYLHEVSTSLVFVILLLLNIPPLGAAAGALFFGLHPLQVESVAWISEGRGLLASSLGLASLALWLYCIGYLDRSSHSDGRRLLPVVWSGIALAWCLFFLSILAKPSTVILPAVLIALARLSTKITLGRLTLQALPWAISGLTISGITAYLQKDLIDPWPWWERGLLAIDSLFFYCQKLIWPSPLLPDYGRQPIFTGTYTMGLLLGATALVGVLFLSWRSQLARGVGSAFLIFSLCLSPQLGIFPTLYQSVSTVADRYTYLALLGPAYGIAQMWSWRPSRDQQGQKILLLIFSTVWFGMLFRTTLEQLPLWKTTETLFQYNLTEEPASSTSPHALGDLAMIRGQVQKAVDFYRLATKARPSSAQGYASLGHALLEDHKPQEASEALRRALAINHQNPSALLNLGVSLQRTGDIAGAVATYLAVNTLRPHPLAYFNLGSIYLQKGSLDQAEASFRAALSLNPRLKQAYFSLERIQALKGRIERRD